MSRFKLITFDATNTLLRFRGSVGETYAAVAAVHGVSSDPEQLNVRFKSEWKRMVAEHPNFGCSSGMSSKQWWSKLVQRTFSGSGCAPISDAVMAPIATMLYDSYKTSQCWAANDGAFEILEKLRRSGHKLGVISNTDERLDSILTALRLRHYFDLVIASSVVKVQKPDKNIFSLALLCASADDFVKPVDALHVGDSIELDYWASKEAGWSALLLLEGNTEKKKAAAEKGVNAEDIIYRLTDIDNKVYTKKSCQVT